MVCGHLDRNALARMVTDLLGGDLANLVTSSSRRPSRPPVRLRRAPARVPRAHPRRPADHDHAAGSQPITTAAGQSAATGQPAAPGQSAATGPVPPGLAGAAAPGTTAPGTGRPSAAR